MEMASLRVLALGCRRWGGVRPRKGWDAGIKTSELVEGSLRPNLILASVDIVVVLLLMILSTSSASVFSVAAFPMAVPSIPLQTVGDGGIA